MSPAVHLAGISKIEHYQMHTPNPRNFFTTPKIRQRLGHSQDTPSVSISAGNICFSHSYGPCFRHLLVSILKEGLGEMNDDAQPTPAPPPSVTSSISDQVTTSSDQSCPLVTLSGDDIPLIRLPPDNEWSSLQEFYV
jgi:hypothetical protein